MAQIRPKPPGRPRSAQAQQSILSATLELLADVGFESMSMDAIATRAKVGKATLYRRYRSNAELVADAIESLRQDIVIPNTGYLSSDLDALIDHAAHITLNPLGRKTVAMIMGSASSSTDFAQIYWSKYLNPRRQAFALVLERAKARQEVRWDLDAGLVFDAMSGIMLYAMLFQTTPEAWKAHVRRSLDLILQPLTSPTTARNTTGQPSSLGDHMTESTGE